VRGGSIARNGDELIEFIRELGRRVGISERRFDPDHYRINLQLPDGSRLFAIGWVTRDPHLFIRRHHYLDVGLGDLPNSMSPMVRQFLAALVRAKHHVVIAGGQGDGKTTLLRAMAAEMDPGERIVTIETDFELGLDRLPHRHHEVIAMEAREANVEGVGQVTCAQLVRDAMRTSSRRVIVGEVLGDEVVPMLNAMNSGAKGSLCSLHADSSAEVFNKLAHPVVASIREVSGFDGERPLTNEIFASDPDWHAFPTGVPLSDSRAGAISEAGFDPRWLASGGGPR
jgi:Flp pilus assembly CpaF family ATPase